MADRLSGVAVIICIAFGIMTFILLFIFAKRQITRFTLKSKYSPHVPIGHDAPKKILQDIDRQLEVISQMQYKPKLFHDEASSTEDDNSGDYLHRVLVLDIFTLFENKLTSIYSTKRFPNQDFRNYLLCLLQSGPLAGCDQQLIHQFIDIYEHARHEPKEFQYEHYSLFIELLEYLYKCINRYAERTEEDHKKLQFLSPPKKGRKSVLVLHSSPSSSHMVKEDKFVQETAV